MSARWKHGLSGAITGAGLGWFLRDSHVGDPVWFSGDLIVIPTVVIGLLAFWLGELFLEWLVEVMTRS